MNTIKNILYMIHQCFTAILHACLQCNRRISQLRFLDSIHSQYSHRKFGCSVLWFSDVKATVPFTSLAARKLFSACRPQHLCLCVSQPTFYSPMQKYHMGYSLTEAPLTFPVKLMHQCVELYNTALYILCMTR